MGAAIADVVGVLVLGLMALRVLWLLGHSAEHTAALRPSHWTREVDRVSHRLDGHTVA